MKKITNRSGARVPKRPIWQEGKYFDLWSVNHFLSGLLMGSLLFLINVSFGWALFVAVALSVGWEIIEMVLKIKEALTNSITDMVLNIGGFLVTAYFFLVIDKPFSVNLVAAIALVFIALEILGFSSYLSWKDKK